MSEDQNPPETSNKRHPWIYVIIPVDKDIAGKKETMALFTAFCKDCRTYFSEQVPFYNSGSSRTTRSSLPRYGCMGEEADEGYSSLPGIDR